MRIITRGIENTFSIDISFQYLKSNGLSMKMMEKREMAMGNFGNFILQGPNEFTTHFAIIEIIEESPNQTNRNSPQVIHYHIFMNPYLM